MVAFIRRGKTAKDQIMFICNFVPVERKNYCFGVPYKGTYKEVFNSSSADGSPYANKSVKSEDVGMHGFEQSISIDIPAFSCMYFSVKKAAAPKAKSEGAAKSTKSRSAAKPAAKKTGTAKRSAAKKAEE